MKKCDNCIDDSLRIAEKLKIKNDKQTKIYNKLHDIGKSINETIEVDEIFNMACDFATQELAFEKCLIFKHDDTNGWFKVHSWVGYTNPMQQRVLNIINLLLSGEVIEYLRVSGKPIVHTSDNIDEKVEKLVKSLFMDECYFELFGGDVNIPYGLIVIGNGSENIDQYSRIQKDEMVMLALGNFTVQLSNAMNNIVFYKAWQEEKAKLEENIEKRTKQIESQKKTFEAIYKTSKDGIAILDLETTAFLDANQAYVEMTGYSKKELLRTSCLKLSIEKDREKSKQAIQKVIKNGFIKDFIKTCIAKDGHKVIVNMSIVLMDDKKSMLVSAKDITKQKELEENLIKESNKAKEATKAKSEFLANMSHEIRTPMNGIIGMTHLSLQTSLTDKQRNYIQKIDNSAKSLLGIINDILDFSKIEAGKLDIENIDFDIFKLVEQVVNLIELKADEKNLKIIVKYDSTLGKEFYGDNLRISQILINLLGNAVKFTHNGEVGIFIEKVKKNRVRFTVHDTGIGLSTEEIGKLFQSFSQADGSTTRKYGGTGLGLTISKQLVELMGGKIWVVSELGVGSDFIFEIDLEERKPKQTFHNHFEQKSIENDITILQGSNILLVEDNQINQEIIIGLLEGSGINLDTASNGKEAVELFKRNKYELILMDIQMPIMDGYEATKIIREINKKIPIIALTANAMKEDKIKTKEVGMNEHLNKPIEVDKLYSTLLKFISPVNSNNQILNVNIENTDIPLFINIDTKIALNYLAGNKKLYLKILNDFYNDYISLNLENLDNDEFQRTVHTLKGLSANIGAKSLNVLLEQLHNTLDRTLLPEFYNEFYLIIDELHTKIINIKGGTSNSKEILNKEKRDQLFNKLKKAVETKRPKKCLPIIEEIDNYNLSKEDEDFFAIIKNYIKKYNFKQAIELMS